MWVGDVWTMNEKTKTSIRPELILSSKLWFVWNAKRQFDMRNHCFQHSILDPMPSRSSEWGKPDTIVDCVEANAATVLHFRRTHVWQCNGTLNRMNGRRRSATVVLRPKMNGCNGVETHKWACSDATLAATTTAFTCCFVCACVVCLHVCRTTNSVTKNRAYQFSYSFNMANNLSVCSLQGQTEKQPAQRFGNHVMCVPLRELPIDSNEYQFEMPFGGHGS